MNDSELKYLDRVLEEVRGQVQKNTAMLQEMRVTLELIKQEKGSRRDTEYWASVGKSLGNIILALGGAAYLLFQAMVRE